MSPWNQFTILDCQSEYMGDIDAPEEGNSVAKVSRDWAPVLHGLQLPQACGGF